MESQFSQYSNYPDYLITSPSTHVLQILIHRPSRHNAFTERMWKHLGLLFNQISHDAEVRAVILSGSDINFTVGLDMHEASKGEILNGLESCLEPARRAQNIRRYIFEFQACISAIQRCSKPVICVLHGLSYGIAIDIASCADIRLCCADTQFSVKEVDIGIAADLGSLSRLPKIIGNLGWIKDVCMSARTFGAGEAMRVGFVGDVLHMKDDALSRALEIADILAKKSPVAVQGTKEILNHAMDHSTEESLIYTGIWNGSALQTKDVPEAVHAWREKRVAKFEKL